MRIMQVMAGAPHGGAETAFVDMCIAMHEAGQTIEVITRANDIRVPRLRAAGIPVHCLPFGGAVDFYTPLMIRRYLIRFKPDIVLTWMSRAAQKVPRWSRSMGIPRYHVVSRLGGYYKFTHFRNTDSFITITPDIKRYLVEKCGVAPENVRHLNNFAETEAESAAVDRASMGVPPEAKLVLCLGRLHHSKAFDTLIDAVADLPEIYVWIAGEGAERPALEQKIKALGVQQRITLLGWRSDRAALFKAADICVFPSRYEPFGTVFVQAWANKVPLVTTDSDGPRQFVHHEEDGLIVPIDNIQAMTTAIRRVATSPDLASKMVENGFRRYIHEFSKEKCVQAYIDYFNEILTRTS